MSGARVVNVAGKVGSSGKRVGEIKGLLGLVSNVSYLKGTETEKIGQSRNEHTAN